MTVDVLELARTLLDAEIGDHREPEQIGNAVERCFERVHDALVGLMGESGFEALLARAASFGRTHLGSFALTVRPATPSARFPQLGQDLQHDVAAVIDGVTSLLGDLLMLSSRFLGEDLVVRIVRTKAAGRRRDARVEEGKA